MQRRELLELRPADVDSEKILLLLLLLGANADLLDCLVDQLLRVSVNRPVVLAVKHVFVLAYSPVFLLQLVNIFLAQQFKQVAMGGGFFVEIELVRFVDLDDLFAARAQTVIEELGVVLIPALVVVLPCLVQLSLQGVLLFLQRVDFRNPVVHLQSLFRSQFAEVHLGVLALSELALSLVGRKHVVDLALDCVVGCPLVAKTLQLRVALLIPEARPFNWRVCDEHALSFSQRVDLLQEVFKLVCLLQVLPV